MKCKDCIYHEKCLSRISYMMDVDEITGKDFEDMETRCPSFIDKGLFLRLPVGLGTPVYDIRKCRCHSRHTAYKCMNHWDDLPKCIAIVDSDCVKREGIYLDIYKQTCYKLYVVPFGLSHINKVNKSVFLDYETAMKRMEEYGCKPVHIVKTEQ